MVRGPDDWLDGTVPSHRCTVCGALWRVRLEHQDVVESWELHSREALGCCLGAHMGSQMVPIRVREMLRWLAGQVP